MEPGNKIDPRTTELNRIEELRNEAGMSKVDLASGMKVNYNALRQCYNRKAIPKKYYSIIERLFEVPDGWITNGGERPSVTHIRVIRSTRLNVGNEGNNYMEVPVVGKDVIDEYVSSYGNRSSLNLPTMLTIKEKEKGTFMFFEVLDNSMFSDSPKSFAKGDMVLCEQVRKENWKSSVLHSNHVFYIITEQGPLLREIIGMKAKSLVCSAYDESKPIIEVPLNSMLEMWLVRKFTRAI